jgi:hypothetical protein
MIGRMDELVAPFWQKLSIVVLSWGSDLEMPPNLDALLHFREILPAHTQLIVRMRDRSEKWLLTFTDEKLFWHFE